MSGSLSRFTLILFVLVFASSSFGDGKQKKSALPSLRELISKLKTTSSAAERSTRYGSYGSSGSYAGGYSTPTTAPAYAGGYSTPTTAYYSSSYGSWWGANSGSSYGWWAGNTWGYNAAFDNLLNFTSSLLNSNSLSGSAITNWTTTAFLPSFSSLILKSSQWQRAYNLSIIALTLASKVVECKDKDKIQSYINSLNRCSYCFGDLRTLAPLKNTAIEGVKTAYKATLMVFGLKPTTCGNLKDFCALPRIDYAKAAVLPICTKSYCWFNTGKLCAPALSDGGTNGYALVATCQTVGWFKGNNISCPIVNCVNATSTATRRAVTREKEALRSGGSSPFLTHKEDLLGFLQSVVKKRKERRQPQICSTTVQCGNCSGDDVMDMDDCKGMDLDANPVCCVCSASVTSITSAAYQW